MGCITRGLGYRVGSVLTLIWIRVGIAVADNRRWGLYAVCEYTGLGTGLYNYSLLRMEYHD